ncbi:MAG: hypothetical protein ACUVRR_07640 [Candidatus Fervidibacter sp.]|uniref:hypothetical protein n=1 Tax=Candidatus Fervidibacter sp. TaxID=3100871 RepID=UPI00404AE0EB
MAKRLVAVIFFAVPLAALLIHPELRRVLMWDLLILGFREPLKAAEALPRPTEPIYLGIIKAEKLQGKKRWLAYEQLYRETGKVWIGVFGLCYAMDWVSMKPIKESVGDAKRLLKWSTELSELDKDNAFPLLAKSYALFALGREGDALSTFHEASLRPKCLIYYEKWLQVTRAVRLTAEEELLGFFNVSLPPLIRLREIAQEIASHAIRAKENGDFERALRLAEDLLKVGKKLREQSFLLADALVGISIQSIALSIAGQETLSGATQFLRDPLSRIERLTSLAQEFAEFARHHGQNELAGWALKEAEMNGRVYKLVFPIDIINQILWETDIRRLGNSRLAGFSLLVSALALAVVGLFAATFLWKVKVTVDSYSPTTVTLVVAGLPMAVIVWGVFGTVREPWDTLSGQGMVGTIYMPFGVLLLLFALCFLPTIGLIKGKVERRLIAVLIGISAFAGALAIAFITISVVSSLLLTILLGLALIGISAVVLWLRAKMDTPNSLVRILSAISFAITVFVPVFVSLLFVAVIESFHWSLRVVVEEMPIFYLLAFTVSAFSFFLMWGIWARFGNQEYRHILQSALAKLRGAAILLFLICWWGYAIVQFGCLPLRSKFHRLIDNFIAHGELALIQEVKGAQLR